MPRPLKITVHARTIVLMEVNATEVARLHGMPSLIYKPRDATGHCYILPPIQYPNGKYYLKIGGGDPDDPTLYSLAELQGWFRGTGSESAAHHLTAKLRAIVPDLCPYLSTRTPVLPHSRLPGSSMWTSLRAAALVLSSVGMAVLPSADEIGRLGALLLQHQEWVYDLEATHFRVRFMTARGPSPT